jgi:CO dehydrogenase/acetyl-CoA synthase beta subunit
MQSVYITTNVVSYYYVIKFVSDLQQVGGFLRVLWFPPPMKLAAMVYMKYC